MNKYLIALCMTGMIMGASLLAQDDDLEKFKQIDKMDGGDKGQTTPAPSPGPNATPQQEPTYVSATKRSTFDGKLKIAVLTGDVYVKNPQYTLRADQLTIYFNKDAETAKKEPGTKKQATATPAPTPKPVPSAAPSAQQGGGIEKLIAEGKVVVETDRPDANGGPPTHYVGKGEKMVYSPATGEAVLSGWPQVQYGMNNMVATESWTVIHLNRDGTMQADGPHKMEIHDPGPDKPSPTPAKSPEVK